MRASCIGQEVASVSDIGIPTTISVDGNDWLGAVTLVLANVATTCVDIPAKQPCAAHPMTDASLMRAPLFYCNFIGSHGMTDSGPYRAVRHSVVDPTTVKDVSMTVAPFLTH